MPLKKHTNLRTERLKTHALKTHALKTPYHSKNARTYELNNSKTHALKILKSYTLFYKTPPASQPLLAKI